MSKKTTFAVGSPEHREHIDNLVNHRIAQAIYEIEDDGVFSDDQISSLKMAFDLIGQAIRESS